MAYLDAKAAADYLGVQVTTLYAYVSRGLIDSVASPGDARRRCYRKADLDRLKQRSDAHAGQAAAASGALRWGAPSLDTAVCEITPAGPSYRGHTARSLVRQGVAFEQAAALLWSGELAETAPRWAELAAAPPATEALADAGQARPLDRMRLALVTAEMDDLARFATSPEARLGCARRITAALAHAVAPPAAHPVQAEPLASVAGLLAARLAPERPAATAAFDAALVSVADHELNASTFAARVAASTGAGLYPSVTAGLAAAAGPRHGGACDRGEALITEVVGADSARAVLLARVRRGEALPGFGHPLYPHGDPRWAMVVARLGEAADPAVLDAVDALVAAADDMALGRPTVDLALATLSRALGLPDGTAGGLFALGRSAGWIAHSLEQQAQGFLLRPRAHYVGP